MNQQHLPQIKINNAPRNTVIQKYHQRKKLINRKYQWINHSILEQPQHQYIQINLNNKVMLIKKKQYPFEQNQMNPFKHNHFNFANNIKNYQNSYNKSLSSLTTCKSLLNSKSRDNKRYVLQSEKRSLTESNHNNSLNGQQRGLTQKINLKKQEEELEPWKDDNKQNYDLAY